ncbi:hypothetical protein ABG067_007236 [Albugo candida]
MNSTGSYQEERYSNIVSVPPLMTTFPHQHSSLPQTHHLQNPMPIMLRYLNSQTGICGSSLLGACHVECLDNKLQVKSYAVDLFGRMRFDHLEETNRGNRNWRLNYWRSCDWLGSRIVDAVRVLRTDPMSWIPPVSSEFQRLYGLSFENRCFFCKSICIRMVLTSRILEVSEVPVYQKRGFHSVFRLQDCVKSFSKTYRQLRNGARPSTITAECRKVRTSGWISIGLFDDDGFFDVKLAQIVFLSSFFKIVVMRFFYRRYLHSKGTIDLSKFETTSL